MQSKLEESGNVDIDRHEYVSGHRLKRIPQTHFPDATVRDITFISQATSVEVDFRTAESY